MARQLPSIKEESVAHVSSWSQGPPKGRFLTNGQRPPQRIEPRHAYVPSVPADAPRGRFPIKNQRPHPPQKIEPRHVPSTRPAEAAAPVAYVDIPWPETDDFGTPALPPPPEYPKVLKEQDVREMGDKIVKLALADLENTRNMGLNISRIFLRPCPTPPHDHALNTYVTKRIKDEGAATNVNWSYSRETIIIDF